MRPRLAALVALAVMLLAPAAAAQAAEPEVLKREPYYLSLFPAEGPSHGTVVMLHGGGWKGDLGPRADEVMADWIARATEWGYDVANLGYRTGLPGFADAVDAFDLVRRRVGARHRLCLFGGSAGAQLALAVAAQRGNEVDCVVDLLGPPDLVHWGSQPAAALGLKLARQAFGGDRLAALSPINMVNRIDAPVLVVAAPCDVFIELAAQARFADALKAAGGDAQLQVVDTGEDVPFGHCNVERSSFDRFVDVMRRFLAGERLPIVAAAAADDAGSGLPAALAVIAAIVALGALGWHLRADARPR